MDGLKALDPVAYIRFASVYKDFTEAGDFAEIAEAVGEEARRPPPVASLRDKIADELSGPTCCAARTAAITPATPTILKRVSASINRAQIPGYTHDRRPVTLVWCQEFPDRDERVCRGAADQGLVASEEGSADSR